MFDLVERTASALHRTPYMVCMEAAQASGDDDVANYGAQMWLAWLSGCTPATLTAFCERALSGGSYGSSASRLSDGRNGKVGITARTPVL